MVKKKTLSAVIAIFAFALFAAAFLPGAVSAKAAEGEPEITFEYEDAAAEDKTITGIRVAEGATGYSVTIPADVKEIGAYAFSNAGLAKVTIPATLTAIGTSAFEGCANLTDLSFEARTQTLTVNFRAFAKCKGLTEVTLPDKATVYQEAFVDCSALARVNVGKSASFRNSAEGVFFPVDTNLKLVFPDQEEYQTVLERDTRFADNHAAACAYNVKVNYYVGASESAVTHVHLNDETLSTLYVQDAAYKSTVWYAERALTNAVSPDAVNAKLKTDSEINLYCYQTVAVPAFPESVSWVYDSKTSYAVSDKAQVLKAMGCEAEFTQAQLDALDFTLVYKDAKGNVLETPETIGESGVYNVMVSLNSRYGEWTQTSVIANATVNVDSGWFTVMLIVLCVVGALALIVTLTTAIVRKKVQRKAKKKQLTSQEVLEKFRAAGGETTLK